MSSTATTPRRPSERLGEHQVLVRLQSSYRPLGSAATSWAPGGHGSLAVDAAGVVMATGSRVGRHRPGEQVFGRIPALVRNGSLLSEYSSVPDWWDLAPMPSGAGFDHVAACISPGLAAIAALDVLQPRTGSRVLVVAGRSPAALFAIQLAIARGASVIASGRGDELELLRALGVDEVIDRDVWDVNNYVRRHRPGGVDSIFDPLGDSTAVTLRAQLLKPLGRLVALEGTPDLRCSDAQGRWAVRVVPRPTEAALLGLAVTIARHGLTLPDRERLVFMPEIPA